MDMKIKNRFIELNKKYFNNAELPATFYYSDTGEQAELVKPGSLSRCVIGALAEVRKGSSFSFNADSICNIVISSPFQPGTYICS